MAETKQIQWTGSYEGSGGAALVTTWICITYICNKYCGLTSRTAPVRTIQVEFLSTFDSTVKFDAKLWMGMVEEWFPMYFWCCG